jgi:tripartite-type tricarboxylate transporter receptor subunit TctC
MKAFRLIAATVVALSCLAPAWGQSDYPNKPIRFIVPFGAGSGTDIVARTLAEPMSKALGQPIVVENRPGAGGTVGAAQVAKAAPDGYTLLIQAAGHVANPSIYPNLPYDTLKDFAGITPLASLPNVLVVSPAKGYKTVKDLVDKAKANPGAMNYASAGVGSATHMNIEILRAAAGFEGVHVPFKGTPEAMTEVVAGRVDVFFAPIAPAIPLIRDGRLQALAVGTATRSPILPDVPTTLEAGYPQSDYIFWVALLAPSATPRAIIDRLNAEALKALAAPEMKEKLAVLGAEAMTMSPNAFDAFLKSEMARMAAVVKAANIKAQ